MVGLAQFIPLFFLTLTAGETADRHDRKLIMAAPSASTSVSAGVLGPAGLVGLTRLWPIFAIAVLFGASRAFLSPASSAMGPMLVPRPLLPRAIAWNSLSWQSGSIIGPALGGLLLRHSPAAGLRDLGVLFLVGGLCPDDPQVDQARVVQPGSRWTLIKEGLVYVLEQQDRVRLDLAGPVRRAAGRGHGPAAGVRPRRAAHRPEGFRPPARRPGRRRDPGGDLSWPATRSAATRA
jgi:hypothetical protein